MPKPGNVIADVDTYKCNVRPAKELSELGAWLVGRANLVQEAVCAHAQLYEGSLLRRLRLIGVLYV